MEVNLAQLIFTLSYKHDTVIAPSDSSRTNEEFSKGENVMIFRNQLVVQNTSDVYLL